MARDLKRLLNRKDDSHYGVGFVSAGDARRMVDSATRLSVLARTVVEAQPTPHGRPNLPERELLYPVVEGVGYVDVAGAVGSDS